MGNSGNGHSMAVQVSQEPTLPFVLRFTSLTLLSRSAANIAIPLGGSLGQVAVIVYSKVQKNAMTVTVIL